MKKIFFPIIILAVLFASCDDKYANSSYLDGAELLPAASFMESSDTLEMTLWVDLLKYADKFTTMNLSANYTCFVPNDAAMTEYLGLNNYSSVRDMSVDEALTLIRYHVIKGEAYNSIDFNEGLISDSTASGDYLSTSFYENGGDVIVNLQATILKTYTVTNGYVHVLNKVLTPVTETIWGILQSEDYSILRRAVEETGFSDKLNTIYEELGPNKLKRTRYTLFAVTDDVYKANGIADFNVLLDSLKATDDYSVSTNNLYNYVAYHLVEQQISYSDLSYFEQTDTKRSRNINTMAENQLINVSEISRILYLNYSNGEGVELVKLNINCKNGVIHTVNNIMPVATPSPSKVQWELTDYPELSVLSDYRKAAGTNSYTATVADIACYTVLPVPESSAGWSYYLSSKGDATRIKAINADYLQLSLGYFGWIEMESPAIIAGKYRVFLEHFNPKGTEKNGKLSFIFDGSYVGTQVTTRGSSTTSDVFLKTAIGEVEFTETTSHTLRILAGDTYTSQIDCVTFEPI